jgi:serine/threonine protein kinase
MAELYVARTPELHGFRKYFAIKRILPRWADDREFVEMFLDEARLAAHLDHPNVVHVHDVGEDDDGLFFAMDYIHGQNLLAIIRRQRTRGSFLPWDAFVALGSAAAAGLHHAHERRGFDGKPLGIIHRDVSPTNILVTYEGAVKIVDFGIAKASTSRHSTRPSVRKGKMAYMSPEQCRGDGLDRRSDVFALGVVLYELATLTRAFKGEGEFAVMNQIVNHGLAPASSRRADIPAELDRILGRAVARDADERYGSARELQRDLDEFAVDAGLMATPDALAALMEELFGASPYPWESTVDATSSDEAAAPTTHATEATAAKPTTAKPTAVHEAPPAVVPRSRPRRSHVLGGLAIVTLASLAWIAIPRGEAAGPRESAPQPASPPEPTIVPVPAPEPVQAAAAAAPPTAAVTARPEPSGPVEDPPLASMVEAQAPSVEPSPGPSTKPERRASKRPRTHPTTERPPASPALPEPFDPDAPAPRVR